MRRVTSNWRLVVGCVVGVVAVGIVGWWAMMKGVETLVRGRLEGMGFRPEFFQIRKLGLWELECGGLESDDGRLAVRSVRMVYSPGSLWLGRIEEVELRGVRVNVEIGREGVRIGPWGREELAAWGGKEGRGFRIGRLWVRDGMVVLEAMRGRMGVPIEGWVWWEGEKRLQMGAEMGLPMGRVEGEMGVEWVNETEVQWKGRVSVGESAAEIEGKYLRNERVLELHGRAEEWGLRRFGVRVEEKERGMEISAEGTGSGWEILRVWVEVPGGGDREDGRIRAAGVRGRLEWSGRVPEMVQAVWERWGVEAESAEAAKLEGAFEVKWETEEGGRWNWAVQVPEMRMEWRDVRVRGEKWGFSCEGVDVQVGLRAAADRSGVRVYLAEPGRVVCRGSRWREENETELRELVVEVRPAEERRAVWEWGFSEGEARRVMRVAAEVGMKGEGLKVSGGGVEVEEVEAEFPLTVGCAGGAKRGRVQARGVRAGGLETEEIKGELAVEDGVLELKMETEPGGVRLKGTASRGQLELSGSGATLSGGAKLDFRRGLGEIRMSLKDLVLRGAEDLEQLGGGVRGVDAGGRCHVHVVVSVMGREIRPWVTVEVQEGWAKLRDWKIEAEGIEAVVHLDRLEPVSSPPWQWMTVRRLNWGQVELREGLVQFDIQSARSVFVERMRWRWGERGRFWVHAFWLDPMGHDTVLEVFLEDVGLRELLTVTSGGKIEGEGFLTGRMNLVVRPGREPMVELGEGYLEARPGRGWFRMADRSAVARKLEESGLDVPGQLRQRIVDALCDFEFSNLSARVREERGELVFQVQMRGKGRSGPEAQEFESLTINLRGVQEILNWVLGGIDRKGE